MFHICYQFPRELFFKKSVTLLFYFKSAITKITKRVCKYQKNAPGIMSRARITQISIIS